MPALFRLAILLLAALTAPPAVAQDRAGRNTPGEWIVTHHKPFGLWDSMCDKRTTGTVTEERCYLRYVDVFSPAPEFAAQFLFVTPGEIEIGTERGTRFAPGGMRIEAAGRTRWRATRPACLRGRDCRFEGAEMSALLDAMAGGGAFRFTFLDRHGAARDLSWDLSLFSAALLDWHRELSRRDLPAN